MADFLDRLGMIAADGTLTNAADVLFCHARPGSTRMSLARLAGNDRVEIIDLRHERGPLLGLLKEAASYVLGGVSRRFVIPKDGSVARREIPEIPAGAVREAIANALVHRDYDNPAAVEVCVYRDTVEIVNPGTFPDGDSPDLHIEGKAKNHGLRNAKLADAVYRTGIIEQFGTGIPRISEECGKAGVTFRYEQDQGFTSIAFDRPGSQIAYVDEDGNPVPPPAGAWGSGQGRGGQAAASTGLDEREAAALRLATENGRVTRKGLEEEAHVGRTAANKTLKGLVKRAF